MNDEKFYRKAIRNDKAFIELLQSMSGQMQAIAYSYYNDDHFVEEVIAETVSKVYWKRKQVRQPQYLKTWIIRVLINEAKDQYQKERRRYELFDEDQIPDTEQEDFSFVYEYLSSLEDKDQEVIQMKIFSDLSFKEMAYMLGESENTVKSRYYRALNKLKRKMGGSYEEAV